MSQYRWIGKSLPRVDAKGKVAGTVKYVTDLTYPDMLWGAVLRSKYPHALIKKIDIRKAKEKPGVVEVLTHEDIPGLNAYGIITQDQPVLCHDKVRFLGDAVAYVLAEDKRTADEALDLIEVEYEPLPVVSDMEEAIKNTVKVHEDGNVLEHVVITKGDAAKAFESCDLTVEETYYTPRQMHTFLETEGGVATIDQEGIITVFSSSQYPNRDIIQIARSLNYPEEKIHVVAHTIGGGFGGKDEITTQILLALGALKTKRPVKMVWDREESVIAGQKRLPIKITLKTGVTKDGKLMANQARVVADTGPYNCLGSAVMKLALEHACGPYYVPNTYLEGYCVYTNNTLGSAFRGFGATQATFAIERQMDLISKKLGIDPLELRIKNSLQNNQSAGLGHMPAPSVGIKDTLDQLKKHDLWVNKEKHLQTKSPHLKRAIGIACSHQGCGLGSFFPDYGSADIQLLPDGSFSLKVGCPDIGQGNATAFVQIAAEALHTHPENIQVEVGDTRTTPDSGSTSASRTIYTGGNAIVIAARKIRLLLIAEASRALQAAPDLLEFELDRISTKDKEKSVTYQEIARRAAERNKVIQYTSTFDWPRSDLEFNDALGLPHYVFSYISEMALVEVNTLTGECQVLKAVVSPDAGRIINRQGLEGQAEGGTVMSMGYALMEDVILKDGQYLTKDLSTYIIPTALDIPEIDTLPVEVLEDTGPFGAKGIGEAVCNPMAPAVVNAICSALDIHITKLPATPEMIYNLVHHKTS